jgi:hypothetical protein
MSPTLTSVGRKNPSEFFAASIGDEKQIANTTDPKVYFTRASPGA